MCYIQILVPGVGAAPSLVREQTPEPLMKSRAVARRRRNRCYEHRQVFATLKNESALCSSPFCLPMSLLLPAPALCPEADPHHPQLAILCLLDGFGQRAASTEPWGSVRSWAPRGWLFPSTPGAPLQYPLCCWVSGTLPLLPSSSSGWEHLHV